MSITAENKRILEDKRRGEIMRAAKLLFYRNGFTRTTMNEVAEEAGISKGLIYHYFKNKTDLLLSFFDEVDDYFIELKDSSDPAAAIRRIGIDLLVNDEKKLSDTVPTQTETLVFAQKEVNTEEYEHQNPITKNFGRGYLGDLFQKSIENGSFKPGDAKTYGDIYWNYLLGKLLSMKSGNDKESPEVYVDELLNMFREQ